MSTAFKNIKRAILIHVMIMAIINHCHAQSQLVLNGGYINITNGASLVVDNPATNAIVRTSGHIISEGEMNRVKWNMGTNTGTYSIPWGYSNSNYIPLAFTKTTGTGNGSFICSTYRTATWQNSLSLPSGVLNLHSAAGASDNSAYVIDRFWIIDAANYTTKPDLSNLIFTYLDSEHSVASNTITESNLKAQRFNTSLNKWGDFLPSGSTAVATNTVQVSTVSGSDLFRSWTLVDNSQPLPIQLISFDGKCENAFITLSWKTASEENNDYFTIEKSTDATDWSVLKTVKGAGNSTQEFNYMLTDQTPVTGTIFYRLKQTDFNGKFTLSEIISVAGCRNQTNYSIYPNPADGYTQIAISPYQEPAVLYIYNNLGQQVDLQNLFSNEGEVRRIDTSKLAAGIYIVSIHTNNKQENLRLVVHHGS